MTTFDDLLVEVGEFGVHQKTIFFLTCLATTMFPYLYVGIVFLAFTPNHWCRGPGVAELRNECGWSLEEERNYTVPPDSVDNSSFSRCERYDIKWNATSFSCENPLSFLQNASVELPLTMCEDGWVFEEGSFPSIVTEFGLVCAEAWKVDLSQSCLNMGFMLGTIFLGFGADIYGRKKCYLFSIFTTSVAGLAVAFAPSYLWFNIFRTLQGLFSKGGWLSAYVLITEIVGMEYRRTVGILNQMCFSLGMILLAAVAVFIPAWRNLQLVATIPCFVFLTYYWLIPESPRWLLSRQKYDEAQRILQNMAKRNKKHNFSTDIKAVQIEDCVEALKSPSVIDLVKTPQIRKHTLILMFNWFASAVVYLGLVMRLGIMGGNVYINFFISGAVELPAAIIIILLIDRIGRRYPFAGGNFLAGASCLITAFIPDDQYWLKAVISSFGKLGITVAFLMVCFVNTELYPTFLRNFAISVCSVLSDFGGIVAPFLLYRLAAIWIEMPLVVFAVIAMIAGALVLFLPETMGVTLPETIEEAETIGREKKTAPKATYELVAVHPSAETSNDK
ncbi:solute carrier family 22 member 2-like [Stegostoma tigrinum]|uniref:solute carrier family 22 member 2-like n=1 Tax=Stegostoma tigrinum TaxID=3053191 RepID=UPI00202B5FDB|nr:solute carrier family 22 member 2-like [Stegostoma tigrinum]